MGIYKQLLVLVMSGVSLSAYAEIYKYVDESGRVTYSNVAKKGAKKLNLDPESSTASRSTGSTTGSAPRRKVATPEDFPRVDGETQKKRDNVRYRLLYEELENEQKQLVEAKLALKEGEATRLGGERNFQKYVDRVQKLKDTVTLHEKNVEALQKELSKTK